MIEATSKGGNIIPNLKPIVRAMLSILVLLSFCFVLAVVFLGLGDIPESLKDASNTILGVLTATLLQVLNFYFGDKA